MGVGMSWHEHTPHPDPMRDTAELPLSQKTEEPMESSSSPSPPEKVTAHTIVVEAVHYYTIPNREATGHYPQSALADDVIHNPALYMDRADF
jgi:hypothetical protein